MATEKVIRADIPDARVRLAFPHTGAREVAISADGTQLLSFGQEAVTEDGVARPVDFLHRWTLGDPVGVTRTPAGWPDAKRDDVWGLAASRDLGTILVHHEKVLALHRVGQEPVILQERMLAARRIAMTPDGTIAATGGADADLRIWDLGSASRIALFPHPMDVTDIALTPDGRYAATGCNDEKMRIVDLRAGTVTEFAKRKKWGRGLWLSPDAAVAVFGEEEDRIRIWDVSKKKLIRDLPTSGRGIAITATADLSRIIVGNFMGIELWDGRAGELLWYCRTGIGRSVGLADDGRIVETNGFAIRVWAPDGDCLFSFHKGTIPEATIPRAHRPKPPEPEPPREPTEFEICKPEMARSDGFDYYLGGIEDMDFFLPKSAKSAVLKRLKKQAKDHPNERWTDIAAAKSYEDMFEAAGIDSNVDDDGNVDGMVWAADEGDWDLLALVAPWVKPGSWFVLKDDEGCFYKAVFEDGELHYYVEAVPDDWLAQLRVRTDGLLSRLERTGWTVDKAAMEAERASMAQFRGPTAAVELDIERPEALLRRTIGGVMLRLCYRPRIRRSWLILDVNAGTSSKKLSWEPRERLDAILDAIDSLKAPVTGPSLTVWLERLLKDLGAEVER